MANSSLSRFVVLYAALYAAFGVASPFLPGLLLERGLSPSAIGMVLGAGSAIRLVAGPVGGRLADRPGAARAVLAAGLAAAAVVALGYAPARGFVALALVSVAHATLLAPLTPVADAMSTKAADTPGPGGFDYGWVRGTGSAAFIIGSMVAGQMVGWLGLGVIVWLNAGLLGLSALSALRVPNPTPSAAVDPPDTAKRPSGMRDLVRNALFIRLMVVAALVEGSHAMHDGFEVIRWRGAGMGPGAAGFLWSESVAAEVLVFFLVGKPVIDRLGVRRTATLCSAAGIVRWSVAARTAAFPAMALTEPLHGLTFALLHLVCMRVIARTMPTHLAATAQAFYGTVAVGAASTVLTFASGPLYGRFGADAFWVMAALCAAAIPIALGLKTTGQARLSSAARTSAPSSSVS